VPGNASSCRFCALVLLAGALALPSAGDALKLTPVKAYPSTCDATQGVAASDGALWMICPPAAHAKGGLLRISPSGKVSGPFRPPNDPYDPNAVGRSGWEVFGLAAGPGGSAWFSSGYGLVCDVSASGQTRCARTPAGQRERGSTRTSTIVEGADGNMWMLQDVRASAGAPDQASITRITPSLQISEYALPADALAPPPLGLVRANGELWFGSLARNSGEIGDITAGGAITSYPLLAEAIASPLAAIGTSGGVVYYLAGYREERLLRVTPNGEQSLVIRAPTSLDPVATPDGSVWALGQAGKAGIGYGSSQPGAIYHVDPKGILNTYALTGRFALSDFEAGLNGLVWALADRVGERSVRLISVSAHGQVVTRHTFTGQSSPQYLTAAPGVMWIVLSGAVKAHRLGYTLERVSG
jgi:hypothetical protein